MPLDKMKEAEASLRKAVEYIPAEVRDRFTADKELSDKDREIILNIARKALAHQPQFKPESKPKAKTEEKRFQKPKIRVSLSQNLGKN